MPATILIFVVQSTWSVRARNKTSNLTKSFRSRFLRDGTRQNSLRGVDLVQIPRVRQTATHSNVPIHEYNLPDVRRTRQHGLCISVLRHCDHVRDRRLLFLPVILPQNIRGDSTHGGFVSCANLFPIRRDFARCCYSPCLSDGGRVQKRQLLERGCELEATVCAKIHLGVSINGVYITCLTVLIPYEGGSACAWTALEPPSCSSWWSWSSLCASLARVICKADTQVRYIIGLLNI